MYINLLQNCVNTGFKDILAFLGIHYREVLFLVVLGINVPKMRWTESLNRRMDDYRIAKLYE